MLYPHVFNPHLIKSLFMDGEVAHAIQNGSHWISLSYSSEQPNNLEVEIVTKIHHKYYPASLLALIKTNPLMGDAIHQGIFWPIIIFLLV